MAEGRDSGKNRPDRGEKNLGGLKKDWENRLTPFTKVPLVPAAKPPAARKVGRNQTGDRGGGLPSPPNANFP